MSVERATDEKPDVVEGHLKPYALHFNQEIRPPANPDDPAADVLERSEEWGAAFLKSVQQNLAKYGLKPGGRVVDYRSLKHWNTTIRGTEGDNSIVDTNNERQWKALMDQYEPFFDREHADENDFLVIVAYPDGESAPIPIRRIPADSLQS